jgi:hypothetical protein
LKHIRPSIRAAVVIPAESGPELLQLRVRPDLQPDGSASLSRANAWPGVAGRASESGRALAAGSRRWLPGSRRRCR